MANVLDFVEIWSGRRGSTDQSALREYARIFRLRYDSTTAGPAEIIQNGAAFGLPQIEDAYQDASGAYIDLGAIAVKVTANQLPDDPQTWDIVVDYSSQQDVEQRNRVIPNPMLRSPMFSIAMQRFSEIVDAGFFGVPIQNSAKTPYVPAPEADRCRLVLAISRYELQPDLAQWVEYQDAVNSDVFFGFPPGTCKINIAGESVLEDGLYCYHVTYTIECRNLLKVSEAALGLGGGGTTMLSAWDLNLIDRGDKVLDDQGMPKALYDSGGSPRSDILLDLAGNELPNPDPQGVGYRITILPIYNKLPYAALNLPQMLT